MPSLYDILNELQQTSGNRGFTYQGRHFGQMNEPPTITEALSRLPTDSPDAEGFGAALPAGVGMSGAAGGLKFIGSSGLQQKMPRSRPIYDIPSPGGISWTSEDLKQLNRTPANLAHLNRVLDYLEERAPQALDELSPRLDLYAKHMESSKTKMSLGALWNGLRRHFGDPTTIQIFRDLGFMPKE